MNIYIFRGHLTVIRVSTLGWLIICIVVQFSLASVSLRDRRRDFIFSNLGGKVIFFFCSILYYNNVATIFNFVVMEVLKMAGPSMDMPSVVHYPL